MSCLTRSVLMLLPVSPYPPRSGNACRDVQQIALLRRLGFDVHLTIIKPREDLTDAEETAALAGTPAAYATTAALQAESRLSCLYRKFTYLAGSSKHAYAWWTEPFAPAEFVVNAIGRARPSVVLLRSMFLHLLPAIRRAFDGPIVVDCHDSDVHVAREAVRSVPGLRKIGPWLNLLAVRRCCRSYLPLVDEIWAVSPEDAAWIAASAPCRRVLVVPSGMPEREISAAAPGRDGVALMIANYGYKPNENGAAWLLRHVWPSVRRVLPDAQLDLVGGAMPPRLRTMAAASPGVRVRGLVESLESFYEEAGVVVVPILEGGGTRLKLVEAWSRGKAVLTTSKGIEGLPVRPDAAVILDEPEAFAQALARLLTDAGDRLLLGKAGLDHWRQRLSYAAIEDSLRRESLLSPLSPDPVEREHSVIGC